MTNYTIRRILLIIPTVFLAATMVFILISLIPGDAADTMASDYFYGDINALREKMGLNRPWIVQYADWLWHLARGDMGTSLLSGRKVVAELMARLPVTLELSILGIIISIIIGIPIGVLSAVRQDTPEDYVGRVFAIAALALPNFWLAVLVVVIPSIYWGWMPPVQYVPFTENPLQNLYGFSIPSTILALHIAGSVMRMMRTTMLEVLRQDYIRTAWAKGLRERSVIWAHAAKNALVPVVSVLGVRFTMLLGGSVVIENIFSLPGLGQWLIQGLDRRDYPMVQGLLVFFAFAVVITNLLVDSLYSYLDPRVRYG